MRYWLSLLRPAQWVKNFVLFAPLLFARRLGDKHALSMTLVGFGSFCLLSSAVYVLNAILDRQSDAAHPKKRFRPLPSGKVSVRGAAVLLLVVLVPALVGSALVGRMFLIVALSYLAVSVAYCLRLKHVVIVDVMAIGAGFVLRMLAGAAAAGIAPSQWLLLCTMLVSLFMGFGKRRAELTELGAVSPDGRAVLEHYSVGFLDQIIAIVTSATIICYILYVTISKTAVALGGNLLILTVPFVLYGVFRYLYLVYHLRRGGSPTRTALTDPPLLFNVLLWAAVCGLILYL